MPWQKSFQQETVVSAAGSTRAISTARAHHWDLFFCPLPDGSDSAGCGIAQCYFRDGWWASATTSSCSNLPTVGPDVPPAVPTAMQARVHVPRHSQLLLLVQASLKTRRHPYVSAATLQVPTLLLPCPRGMLCFAKAMQNMQQVSPLSPAGHVTTSRTLFFPNSCDKLCFLPLHTSTHILCHSRAICCCCSAGAGRGSSQLLAQPRTPETRKPFPHVLMLGEGPREGLHQVLDIFCPSHPSLQPISLLFPNFLLFLSSMLCVFSFLSPPHVLPLNP